MEMTKIATEQEVRDIILKCCKEYISDSITELDISFDSSNSDLTSIEVKIPGEQHPKFRVFDIAQETPKIKEFALFLESYSSGNLVLTDYDEHSSIENGHYFKSVLSLGISCSYQIEK